MQVWRKVYRTNGTTPEFLSAAACCFFRVDASICPLLVSAGNSLCLSQIANGPRKCATWPLGEQLGARCFGLRANCSSVAADHCDKPVADLCLTGMRSVHRSQGAPPHPRNSGGATFVPVMEPAHLRDGNYPAGIRGLHCPGFRRVFAQRQMSPRCVIIRQK